MEADTNGGWKEASYKKIEFNVMPLVPKVNITQK